MTVAQLVSDLRNIAESGSNAIEFRLEDSQLIYWSSQVRAMLISQAIQKHQDISDIWLQQISCLELEEVDKSECCDITTGCTLLRTIQKLPNTIETNADNSIVRVETVSGGVISRSNPFEAKYTLTKYTKFKPKWYLKGGYIYVINDTYLRYINVVGLFENPQDLANFDSCTGSVCFGYDSEFPCSLKMASMITDIVLKTKIYPYLQQPQDKTNDADSNQTTPPNKKGQDQ